MALKWLKFLFSKKKQYVYGYDNGNGDIPAFIEGYIDKKGVYHIIKITHDFNRQ